MRPDVASLVKLVEDMRRQHTWPLELPEGARLRMHPATRIMLWQEPDLARFTPGAMPDPAENMASNARLPLEIDETMEPGAWQLVLGEGKLEE